MYRKETKTTGIEPFIIECLCLRLKEHEALSYLSDRGYDIGRAEYYLLRKDVRDNRQLRLNHIASEEFLFQHLDRIENLKTIEDELWNNYHIEKNPTNKSKILMQIAELQQYLSSYYDHTQYVMQQAARTRKVSNGTFDKQQEKN